MNINVKISKQDFIAFHTENFLNSKLFKSLLVFCYLYLFILYIALIIIIKNIPFTIVYMVVLLLLFTFRNMIFSKIISSILNKFTKKQGNQYLFAHTKITLQDDFLIIDTKYSTRILKLENIKEILLNKDFTCINFNTQDSVLVPNNLEFSQRFTNSILKITNLQVKKLSGGKNENKLSTH